MQRQKGASRDQIPECFLFPRAFLGHQYHSLPNHNATQAKISVTTELLLLQPQLESFRTLKMCSTANTQTTSETSFKTGSEIAEELSKFWLPQSICLSFGTGVELLIFCLEIPKPFVSRSQDYTSNLEIQLRDSFHNDSPRSQRLRPTGFPQRVGKQLFNLLIGIQDGC